MAVRRKKGLKEKVSLLPDACGVYVFKGAGGRCLYIGKANSLKKRVQSYFSRRLDLKTQALVSKIRSVGYILSPSPAEAQILEASLVKTRQPPYNISLKDDKSFPLVKITDEEFPAVYICRRKGEGEKEKARYFGPYTDAAALRLSLKAVRGIFAFRSCRSMPKKPCLYYRLALCPAPCVGRISAEDYLVLIKKIAFFLHSPDNRLLKQLNRQMWQAARERDFEKACRIRDQAGALSILISRQKQAAGTPQGLKEALGLKRAPLRIEAFDISNISGSSACGAMASFYNGAPDKNNYRRFRVKTVARIDDYAMLKELVRRRYLRLKEEEKSLPDLVLIDGGKGHLLAVHQQIKALGLDIPLVSIAKDKENIYIYGRRPFRFGADNAALNLLRRVRDEAHRFAIQYHRLLRRKKIIGK